MTTERYDFVVFGATGFTGQFVVEEIARSVGTQKRWAIAGRTEPKLRSVLTEATKNVGVALNQIPIIIADVSDTNSLAAMAKQSKIVLNCVGPYRFFGEAVVAACVENGASCLDISGEPQYLESMQLKYNEKAEKNGVYIIGCCGFDCIPIETGIQFVKQMAPGDVNGVETFAEFKSGPKGSSVHYGTFQSAIYGIAHWNELKGIRQELCPKRLPRTPFHLPSRMPLFYHDDLKGWCIPFLGADKSVAYRTNYYNYFNRSERPVQVNTFMKVGSLINTVGLVLWGMMFALMSRFAFGRNLLEKYPKLFSFGIFSHEGPTREQLKETSFQYWFFARGWSDKLADKEAQHTGPPDRSIVCRIDGPDPGYVGTAACLVSASLTVLEDKNQLPGKGGVFTPGAAFQNTNLINRLKERNVKFSVVKLE